MILETDRLILRPYRFMDAEAIHRYGSDPEVCRYTNFGPNTWEDTIQFVNRASDSSRPEIELAITLRGDDTVVGGVGAFAAHHGSMADHPHDREMGWILRRDLWGRGIATEAAEALLDALRTAGDVAHVYARCRPQNAASARVMQKIGMRQRARVFRDYETKGAWVDSLLFSTKL